MDSVFHRTTSILASSTSESSESRRIVQSEEITIEDFTKNIDDWKIPKISQTQIYQKSKYNIFKTDFTIKTEERDIQLTKPFETIQLLSQKSLQKHLAQNYKYIHVGLVQVGIKPLTKEGLNTSILAVLRDTRFQNFQDSLLSSIKSSLCSGPVSFDCYPNITISLKDKNILQSMLLQIKTHNYDMLEGSIPVALIFKIHYKAMFSAFASKHKFQSQKGETLLLQTNLSRSNTVVPKAIQWKDISLLEDWILEGAAPPELPQPPQPNVQIKNITQYTDGKVKLSFHRHSTSSRFSEGSSSSSTIDLGRISNILFLINIPYHANSPRKSTSDIPSTSFQNADYTTNIPKPVYTDLEQPSPPTSPTFSAVTENIQNELNVLTSKNHFVINKTLFRRDFYGDHNIEKRTWFFQHFLQQRNDIQKQFYTYIETHEVKLIFFDWFEFHYVPVQHITYPFASIKHACPITTRSKTPTWTLTSGPTIESDHPPLRNIQLTHKDQTVDAAPYKLPGEDTLTNTKHII